MLLAGRAVDPLPLSGRQIGALVASAVRELAWTQRGVSRLVARWRAQAIAIPDSRLRAAALRSLDTKRGHTNGAALFAVLPRRRDPWLLELLVAYEVMWDYLDSAHELAPDERNGRQLHLALIDALQPAEPVANWYLFNPGGDDGNYLATLVRTCRLATARLPSYARVRPQLVEQARRGQVLALNHLVDAAARDSALRRWAAAECPHGTGLQWWEWSGAASASMLAHALFALAAEPELADAQVEQVMAGYWPWISLATTMLDSYVDRIDDERNGDHSYIAHYPTEAAAIASIEAAMRESAAAALAMPRGHRHAMILACMIALYLSKESATTPSALDTTRNLLRAGGTLPQLLRPALILWRTRYRQRPW